MFGKQPTINTNPEAIKDILHRGVEDVFVKEHLEAQLSSGKQLRVKLGFDPTSANIHIGRAIVLRKLKKFQDLGHQIVFIVGDFTAQVGDPSDKLEKRPMLTKEVIEGYVKDYKQVVGKIIDVSRAEFVYNSTWLSKLGFQEISQLAESFTVQQMLARRNFSDRIEKGQEISVREFLYPLMQGYDSVAVHSDVELGGFDQLFNVKAGRVIQKYYNQPEQDVLTTQMLEGTDGRKMSSSWGNVINITDEPNNMYGKILAVHDDLMAKYFLLCTDVPESDIEDMKAQIASGANPKKFKMRLARDLVTIYHNAEAAMKAEESFTKTFSQGGIPEDIETVSVEKGILIADVLVEHKVIASKSEWRRLIEGGGVHNAETEENISDPFAKVENSLTLKVGKRRFIKITIK